MHVYTHSNENHLQTGDVPNRPNSWETSENCIKVLRLNSAAIWEARICLLKVGASPEDLKTPFKCPCTRPTMQIARKRQRHGDMHKRLCAMRSLPHLLLLLLPLLRRVAFGRPGVYGGDLGFEGRVDEAVAREESLFVELGGDDYGIEGLAATACAMEEE